MVKSPRKMIPWVQQKKEVRFMKKKSVAAVLMTAVMTASLFTGCAGGNDSAKETSKVSETNSTTAESTAVSKEDLSGTLTFAIWDNNLNDFIESNDMIGKFQEIYPNVDIEVEKIKDDSEYWDTMKMRASANQLPDIMFNKPFTLSRFKDYLLDLSGTEAANNTALAAGYAIDGKVLGIPMTVFSVLGMFTDSGRNLYVFFMIN